MSKNKVTVTLLGHACLMFETPQASFVTAPWIEGFAFAGGWWPKLPPPVNWKEKINSCDFIYISHNHSDHLNEFTLKHVRKDMDFIIPDFESRSVEKSLKSLGFNMVRVKPFNVEIVYRDFSFTILKSGDFRDDSGFLLNFRKFKFLSSVDSNNLNYGILPEVDVFASSFAGGASGYPLCFDNVTHERKKEILDANLVSLRESVDTYIHKTSPSYFLPYAGFADYPMERDSYIKENDPLLTASDYQKTGSYQLMDVFLADQWEFIIHYVPYPTVSLESSRKIKREEKYTDYQKFIESVFTYTKVHRSTIEDYFQESGFHDNLRLYLSLTDDDFNVIKGKSFIVNFSKKTSEGKICRQIDFDWEDAKLRMSDTRLLYIKVRKDAFGWVVKNKKPWEDLIIGYQVRIDRVPDEYNKDFWFHFTNIYIS